jgi:hypothetical protein
MPLDGVHEVIGEIRHVLGYVDVLDFVEILLLGPHFVRIGGRVPINPLSTGSSAVMCSRLSASRCH